MRRLTIVVSSLSLCIVGRLSLGQTFVPRTDRPITVPEGQGELGFDLSVDVSKDTAGERVEVGSDLFSDRRDGVSVAAGISRSLEFGAAFSLVSYRKGQGTNFGGFYLYARAAALPYLALEVGLLAPSKVPWKRVNIKRVAAQFAVEARYPLVRRTVVLRTRLDTFVGFAKNYYNGDEGPPQYAVFWDVGAVVNATPRLFVEVAAGLGKVLKGRDIEVQGVWSTSKGLFLPVEVLVGYSVLDTMDIGVGVAFRDVLHHFGRKNGLTLTLDYRF